MSAPRTFTFKPAPLRGPETYLLDGGTLTQDGDWSLDLSDVTDAAFVNQLVKSNRMVRLDLYAGDTRRSLGYNGTARAYEADGDAKSHLAACAATLQALSQLDPDRNIALGVIRGGRWGMFIVGLGALLGGVILAVAMLASGVSDDRLITAAIPTLFLILLGAVVTYGNWPWRPRPRVKAAALAKTLDQLVNPTN